MPVKSGFFRRMMAMTTTTIYNAWLSAIHAPPPLGAGVVEMMHKRSNNIRAKQPPISIHHSPQKHSPLRIWMSNPLTRYRFVRETGTIYDPIMVKSFGDEQYCGCTGFPADSHVVKWLIVWLPPPSFPPYLNPNPIPSLQAYPPLTKTKKKTDIARPPHATLQRMRQHLHDGIRRSARRSA